MIHRNIIQVLLVLTALAFICNAQRELFKTDFNQLDLHFLIQGVLSCIVYVLGNQSGEQCLCASFRSKVDAKKNISDIQIYPQTDFCSQVEIVITNRSGGRYCLNPKLPVARKFLARVIQ
uniref:Chemokine interleukin-8-like domain-containing protein n=1 Tax=Neogobius melanostomus TaxID=47308 RepID=A0A8C6UPY2_9GOBI